tara:strand:- start:479 stop:925 length:447 start_codon:yes stop_codon:yes gene_type:complete
MNLKELKKMIAEEYSAYTQQVKEQDMGMDLDMPAPPNGMEMPSIDVGDDDIKVGGGEDAETTLKDIYDMLKDFFEGDDKPAAPKADNKKDDKADDKADDKKDDKADDKKDDKEDDKEEIKESRRTKSQKIIAENQMKSRFKKLANIIK